MVKSEIEISIITMAKRNTFEALCDVLFFRLLNTTNPPAGDNPRKYLICVHWETGSE